MMSTGHGTRRRRSAWANQRRARRSAASSFARLEALEQRSLLTIYSPTGVTLSPTPIEGIAFTGAVVGTFATADSIAGLSASINWGSATNAGTITQVGSVFVPGLGTVPQYTVTGGTTFAEETHGSTLPVFVTVLDSADDSSALITSHTAVADAPLTTVNGCEATAGFAGTQFTFTGTGRLMTFTDANPLATASDFTATIDWGDGTPATVGTIKDLDGSFGVEGYHIYKHQSEPYPTTNPPFTVTVKVADEGGSTLTYTGAVTVVGLPLNLAPTLPVFHGTQRQPLAAVPIGVFYDPNPYVTPADFNATIIWGDGADSDPTGVIVPLGLTSDGQAQFALYGSHTYNAVGTYSPFALVTERAVNIPAVLGSVDSVVITASTLSVGAFPLTGAAGVAIPADTILGTFTDSSGALPAGSYTASIDWGDAVSSDTSVTITSLGGSSFSVATNLGHTYSTAGNYALKLHVQDADASGIGSNLAMITGTPAALKPIITAGLDINTTEGALVQAQVATFTSPIFEAVASDFRAYIDWGDGSPISAGIVNGQQNNSIIHPNNNLGTFRISGSHRYSDEGGPYTVTVFLSDTLGNRVSTTITASVTDAQLSSGVALPVYGTVRQPINAVPIASFIDANPYATAADFSASVLWGDGSPADANLQVVLIGGDASGAKFAVYGTHAFPLYGFYSPVVTVTDKGGSSIQISGDYNVTIANSTIGVNVLPLTAASGVTIPASTLLGSFTTANPAPLAQYSASIDWGDGTSSDGGVTITQVGGTTFNVATSIGHVYVAPGTYAIKITAMDGTSLGVGGNLVVVADTTVIPAPIIEPAQNIETTEGAALTAIPVATFESDVFGAVASNFRAYIDWGDGTPIVAGVISGQQTPGITLHPLGGVASFFTIAGTHRYAEEGSYAVTVYLTDLAGHRVETSLEATVSDAPLTNATGLDFTAFDETPLVNIPVATFVDGNRYATAADFLATINWGDGSDPTTGYVTLVGGSGKGAVFSVTGSHAYAHPGPFLVTVDIVDEGGSTAQATRTVLVHETPITAMAGQPIVAVEGQSTSANTVVATFRRGLNMDPAEMFTAMIRWGDGSQATGVIENVGMEYAVLAPTHIYAEAGSYAVSVVIQMVGEPLTGVYASNVATIKDAPLTAVPVAHPAGVEFAPMVNAAVGGFLDGSYFGSAEDFTATIYWGDGSPATAGVVTRVNNPAIHPHSPVSNAYVVTGTHAYGDAGVNGGVGHFPITVIVKDVHGSRVVLTNTADVSDASLSLTGVLDPRSDSGPSNADAVTNVQSPLFLGYAQPGARVGVSIAWTGGTQVIGWGVSNAAGQFSVKSTMVIPDGSYRVYFNAVDAAGITAASYVLPQMMVIDTVGPKIMGLAFDRFAGKVYVSLADDRSGLDQRPLVDGTNYQFARTDGGVRTPYLVNTISATPAPNPTAPQNLVLSLRSSNLPDGTYTFTIDSAGGSGTLAGNGLRDMAGNALDGEFYGLFRSGNNKPGGDFIAGYTVLHGAAQPPVPVKNGYATPNTAAPLVGRQTTVVVPTRRAHAVVAPTHVSQTAAQLFAARAAARLARARTH